MTTRRATIKVNSEKKGHDPPCTYSTHHSPYYHRSQEWFVEEKKRYKSTLTSSEHKIPSWQQIIHCSHANDEEGVFVLIRHFITWPSLPDDLQRDRFL